MADGTEILEKTPRKDAEAPSPSRTPPPSGSMRGLDLPTASVRQAAGNLAIQRLATGGRPGCDPPEPGPATENALRNPSGGEPLPASTQKEMEAAFGLELSAVRVHGNLSASRAARELHAAAFTHGQHIYFGAGGYRPETAEGERLLTHELVHTLQQRPAAGSATGASQSHPRVDHPDAPLEQEADAVAREVVERPTGGPAAAIEGGAPPRLARTPGDGPLTIADLLNEDGRFVVPELDAAYQDYIKGNPAPLGPVEWAQHQTRGAPRETFIRLLGPDFARRGGTGPVMITLSDIARPADYPADRLDAEWATLSLHTDDLFRRLQRLLDEGAQGGQISSGLFSILQGNVAEILSIELQRTELARIRASKPDAELFTGVTMQIVLQEATATEPAVLSQPLLFTDNIIGSIRPAGVNIYSVFETKSGPESGGAAATQIHKWIERHLEEGVVLNLPGRGSFTYGPGGTGTVVGLARAERHPIVPAGVTMPGRRSGHGVAAPVLPHALPQTPEQIRYLTRLVVDAVMAARSYGPAFASLQITPRQAVQAFMAAATPSTGTPIAEGMTRALTTLLQGLQNSWQAVRQLDSVAALHDSDVVKSIMQDNKGLVVAGGTLYKVSVDDPVTQRLVIQELQPKPLVVALTLPAPANTAQLAPSAPTGVTQPPQPVQGGGIPTVTTGPLLPPLTRPSLPSSTPSPGGVPSTIPALPSGASPPATTGPAGGLVQVQPVTVHPPAGGYVTAEPPVLNLREAGDIRLAGSGTTIPPSATPVAQSPVKVGELILVGGQTAWAVCDLATGKPIAAIVSGGQYMRVTEPNGKGLILDWEGRVVPPTLTTGSGKPVGLVPEPNEPATALPSTGPLGRFRSGPLRTAGAVGGLFAALNDILAPIGAIYQMQRAHIRRGWAEVDFWIRYGADPSWGIWDQNSREVLSWNTATNVGGATGFDSTRYAIVTKIDIARFKERLPSRIADYQEFATFLDLAGPGQLGTILKVGDDKTNFCRHDETCRYKAKALYWEEDVTDLIEQVRQQVSARAEQTASDETAALPYAQRGSLFRLRSGSSTKLYRGADDQPIVSAPMFLGPDPWVRSVGDDGKMRRESGQVLVAPANGDALKAALNSSYLIHKKLDDVKEEVEAGGRAILSESKDGILEAFVAGPRLTGERPHFGITRYYRHPEGDFRFTWSVAVGELKQFWVDADELEPIIPKGDFPTSTRTGAGVA